MAKPKLNETNEIGVRPLGKTVLVQVKAPETVTKSGIFIPESVKDASEQREATVIVLGSGKLDDGKTHTFEVKPGDTVLVRGFVGTKFEKKGKEYIVVNESDIVAIID